MASASFNPPQANLPGKPSVPEWVPPPVTKETHNFATLKSIDLSLLDSEDPAVVDHLVQQVKLAIRDDGFLFLENYGISLEQVSDMPQLVEWFKILTPFLHSFTDSFRSRNIFTKTSVMRTRNVCFSAPRPVFGLATSTHMDSR